MKTDTNQGQGRVPVALLKVTSHAEQYHGKETGKTEFYAEAVWPQDEPKAKVTGSVLGRGYTGAEAVADWNRRAAADGHRVVGVERNARTDTTQNNAVLFSPLRVLNDGRGGYDVVTRADDTPGSRNNFVLASCQHRPEAQLFAAAPELLAALKEAREVLQWVVQEARGKLAKEKVGGWEHHANKLGALIIKAGGAL